MSYQGIYKVGWGVAAAAFFLLFPIFVTNTYYIHLLIEIFIFSLFGISFNLLFGYGGMLPFGHAAVFGVGAYITALTFNHFPQIPLLLGLLGGALSAFVTGAIIGIFCTRLTGAYLAICTLAFQMFFYAVALMWRSVTGGDDGMVVFRPNLNLSVLGSLSMSNIHNIYYLTLVLMILGVLSCYLFLKTPLGNAVVCMRENDIRASFLGYHAYLTKIAVFSVSGLLAGLAGGNFALFQGFVSNNVIDLDMGITIVLMVVIGGTGKFLGPILGVAIYLVFQTWLSSITPNWPLFMGIFFVVVVIYLQGGLITLPDKLKRVRFGVVSNTGERE